MKKILIVEGNLREENQSFTDGGIKTHTESLKDSISYFTRYIEIDVVNPSSDSNISDVSNNLIKFSFFTVKPAAILWPPPLSIV